MDYPRILTGIDALPFKSTRGPCYKPGLSTFKLFTVPSRRCCCVIKKSYNLKTVNLFKKKCLFYHRLVVGIKDQIRRFYFCSWYRQLQLSSIRSCLCTICLIQLSVFFGAYFLQKPNPFFGAKNCVCIFC